MFVEDKMNILTLNDNTEICKWCSSKLEIKEEYIDHGSYDIENYNTYKCSCEHWNEYYTTKYIIREAIAKLNLKFEMEFKEYLKNYSKILSDNNQYKYNNDRYEITFKK